MKDVDPKLAIVIPARNEELAIHQVVSDALRWCPRVIVVDDGSTDATCQRLEDLPITLIRHAQSRGKGQALRSGFDAALHMGCTAVLSMDGDGQHCASDIPRIVAAAHAYPDHLVIGARLLDLHSQPPARRRANAVADWGISWGCGTAVADTQSGQRYYPQTVLEYRGLHGEDFVFEAAILIAAVRELDLGVVAVPIKARYQPEFRASHFRPVHDITRITLYTIGKVLQYGKVWQAFRRSRHPPAKVFDVSATSNIRIPT